MNMLRHDHVANDFKLIPAPDTFQPILKQIPIDRRSQITKPSKATKSCKVKVPHVLIPLQTDNHHAMLRGILTQ